MSLPTANVLEPAPVREVQQPRSDLVERIHRQSKQGVALTLAGQSGKLSVHLASICILSRLLPKPEDFGVLGMVVAFTGFLEIFKDFGLGLAIVQRRHLEPGLVGALFAIVMLVSAIFAGAVLCSAPALAWFYHEPRVKQAVPFLAAAILANGLCVIPQALCRREMLFGRIAVIDIIAPCVGVATAVVAALQGLGVRSLALQPLCAAITAVGLYWMMAPRTSLVPVWNRKVLEALWFGGHLSGFSFMNYWARNFDNVLIGRFWGPAPLGIYARAYQLLLGPVALVNGPLALVYISSLSRLRDDAREFRNHYLQGLKFAAILSIPLSAVLVVCADEVVRLAMGSGWDEVIVVFRLLAISAAFQCVNGTAGWLYLSMGRTDRQFRWGVVASLLLVASFVAGLPFGPRGVALSYSLMMIAITVPSLWYASRGTRITVLDAIRSVLPGLAAAALAALIAFGLQHLPRAAAEPAWARDLMVLAGGGLAAVLPGAWFYRRNAGWTTNPGNRPRAIDGAAPITAIVPRPEIS